MPKSKTIHSSVLILYHSTARIVQIDIFSLVIVLRATCAAWTREPSRAFSREKCQCIL